MTKSSHIVGIDLGTTNSVVATYSDQQIVVVGDTDQKRIQPSVVSFHPNGNVIVGAEAKQRRIIDPRNTIYSVKRIIGRAFDSLEVQESRRRISYQLKEGTNNRPVIGTRSGDFAATEISAIVLDHVTAIANQSRISPLTEAVITVPASFNDAQRSATATAGAIAGLKVARIINEPTAAALAYGFQRSLDTIIAVYDFGGGTFDVTLLQLRGNVFQVLGTAGDSFLGGDDLDEKLVDHMVNLFLQKERMDLRHNEISMQRLRAVAEQTKVELSRRDNAVVKIEEIAYGDGGKPLHLEMHISRDEFVDLIAPLVNATFPVCKEALRMAGIKHTQVKDVVLVGGTTKIPYIRKRVAAVFDRQPRVDVNPEEAVARGAALQAVIIERERLASQKASTQSTRPRRKTEALPLGMRRRFVTIPPKNLQSQHLVSGDDTVVESQVSQRLLPKRVTGTPLARITSPSRTLSQSDTDVHETREGRAVSQLTTDVRSEPQALDDKTTDKRFPEIAHRPLSQLDTDIRDAKNERALSDLDTDVPDPINERAVPKRDAEIRSSTDPTTQRPSMIQKRARKKPLSIPPPVPQRATDIESLFDDASEVAHIIDVTPQGIGIGTIGEFCEKLIARNKSIPTEVTRIFSTSKDDQVTVKIRVFIGENRLLTNNTLLGELTLDKLIPRRRGQTNIEVRFRIDSNGILQVRAKDVETKQETVANLNVIGTQSKDEFLAAQQRMLQIRQRRS